MDVLFDWQIFAYLAAAECSCLDFTSNSSDCDASSAAKKKRLRFCGLSTNKTYSYNTAHNNRQNDLQWKITQVK